jgi:hypothetical protein
MFGKSKIRAEFENAFKAGDEATIQKMLADNPWLLAEWEAKMEGGGSADQQLVLAALGVMTDEISGPAPVDDISYCIRVDFKKKLDDGQINSLLAEAETLGYCHRAAGGWELTPEGAKVCDNYLNSHAA